MGHVLVGLGSNLGDSTRNIEQAIDRLAGLPGLQVVRSSTLVQTHAVGGPADQPDFLNAAVLADTSLEPTALLPHLLQIEREMGRDRTHPWGPRTIDLDLLCHGDRVIESEQMTVPHRWMCVRSFVMKPCSEIAPGFTHPTLQKTVGELWQSLRQPTGIVAVLPVDSRDRERIRQAISHVCQASPWLPYNVDSSDLPMLVECGRAAIDTPGTSLSEHRAVIVFDRKQPPVGLDRIWQRLPELTGWPRAPAVSVSIADGSDAASILRIVLAAITATA